MLVGGIYFGEKTIWDEIIESMKKTGLWSDNEIDRLKEEAEDEKEPNEIDVLVESLLNYKDVLEGKVRELTEENEKLQTEIERQDEKIEKLENKVYSLQLERDTLKSRCTEEAKKCFENGFFKVLEIYKIGEKKECDCGDLRQKIEELQSEVRDLTAENARLKNQNSHLTREFALAKYGNILEDNEYEELKEKYKTVELEREKVEG